MKAQKEMGELRALKESDVMLTDIRQDIRSREVRDIAGEKIGTIDELLIDDRERQVRLLLVDISGPVRAENIQVLIPVDAITLITDAEVYIRRTRRHVTSAPVHDSCQVDQRYLESVYAYYGYYPYWAPCYSFPTFPVFPNE